MDAAHLRTTAVEAPRTAPTRKKETPETLHRRRAERRERPKTQGSHWVLCGEGESRGCRRLALDHGGFGAVCGLIFGSYNWGERYYGHLMGGGQRCW